MIKFGTGGWRAIIGDDFTKSNIRLIAHSIAYLNIREGNLPIVIGYDNRFLSQDACEWVSEYLNECGIDTYVYSESVPTPLVMHYVKTHGLNYGVMITASHNSYKYNGIKVFVKGGLDAPLNTTWDIEEILYGNTSNFIPRPEKEGKCYLIDFPFKDYIDDLYSFLNIDAIKNLKFNIAFNSMNGSANELFEHLMKKLGLENNYISYAADADPYFDSSATNTPEPTKENIAEFIDFMKFDYIKYHLGIVFDGDGDRLMVLDEYRNVVDMNTLLCIYYWYLHEYRHESGAIVKNCVTTSRLQRMADYYNEKCFDVPVGFKWITDGMNKYNALIGGESSGGFTYRGHVYGKDSILATMLLLEVLAVTKMPLSKIVKTIDEKFGTDIFISEKQPIPENLDLSSISIEGAKDKVTIDGVKFIMDSGWISIRPSGTEPILRIMVEASNSEIANNYLKLAKDIISNGNI